MAKGNGTKCTRCMTENPDTAVYCSKCGASMPTVAAGQNRKVSTKDWLRGRTNSLLVMGLMLAILGIIFELRDAIDQLGYWSYAPTMALFFWFLGFLVVAATLLEGD